MYAIESRSSEWKYDVDSVEKLKCSCSSVWSVRNNPLEIIINIEVKFSVQNVLISIGNGKRNSNARKSKCQRLFSKESSVLDRYLQAFQKVRDCSSIHVHEGTPARIQVWNKARETNELDESLFILVGGWSSNEEITTERSVS